MKLKIASIIAAFSMLLPGIVGATTLSPIQLLNPTGSTSGQAIVSTGSSTAPAWQSLVNSVIAGSGVTVSGATGNVTISVAANSIALSQIAQQGANTVLANATGSTANVTAFSMPSCSTSSSALNWTSGTGFTCNTGINATSLGGTAAASYALLASPALTGAPTAPTAATGTSTTQIATTAFVQGAIAGGKPYFSAVMSGNQTLTAGTITKVAFNTKVEDSNTAYSTTNYRFTPQTSGLYWVYASLYVSSTSASSASNNTAAAYIYKNGSSAWETLSNPYQTASTSVAYSIPVSGLVRLNGSTDYVEAWGYIATGQTVPTVFSSLSSFMAFYIGP